MLTGAAANGLVVKWRSPILQVNDVITVIFNRRQQFLHHSNTGLQVICLCEEIVQYTFLMELV
jgi:hypothetical protein